MTGALDGFTERDKTRKKPSPDFPAITVTKEQTTCGLLHELRKQLGDPEHIKFLFNEPRLAIVPADGEEQNSYVVSNGSIAIGWLKTEWGWLPDPGRYRVEINDGVGIVDFSDGPFES